MNQPLVAMIRERTDSTAVTWCGVYAGMIRKLVGRMWGKGDGLSDETNATNDN